MFTPLHIMRNQPNSKHNYVITHIQRCVVCIRINISVIQLGDARMQMEDATIHPFIRRMLDADSFQPSNALLMLSENSQEVYFPVATTTAPCPTSETLQLTFQKTTKWMMLFQFNRADMSLFVFVSYAEPHGMGDATKRTTVYYLLIMMLSSQ